MPASAAEGFFLISGIMAGYVYGPKILSQTRSTFIKVWKRAGLLWLLCVLFTLFYTAWALAYPDSVKYATTYTRDGISFLYNTFLLRYSFGWADFLSRYAWFMFAAPFALLLIAKKLWWIVAAVSISIWAIFRHTEALLPFSAWQIIFMFGLIIGFYFPQIQRRVSVFSLSAKRILSNTFIWIFVITYIASIVIYVITPITIQLLPIAASSPLGVLSSYILNTLNPLLGKTSLDPLRLIVGSFWFIGLYLLVHRYEKRINQLSSGVFEVLGKNSLFVYCLHAFLLFTLDMYLIKIDGLPGIITTTLIALLMVTVIYFSAKNKTKIYKLLHLPFKS